MEKSEKIDKLAAALSKAQGSLMGAKKNCTNPFHKSKYADLSSVISAAAPALQENELSVVQTTELIDGKPVLRTTLMHSSGQYMSGVNPLYMPKGDMQSLGAAITYARRYAYSSMIGVVSDIDDDGESIKQTSQTQSLQFTNQKPKSSNVNYAQRAQATTNSAARKHLEGLPEEFQEYVLSEKGIDSLDKLTDLQAAGAVRYYPQWNKAKTPKTQETANA